VSSLPKTSIASRTLSHASAEPDGIRARLPSAAAPLSPYSTLFSTGIELQSDGSLELDQDKLEEALTANPDAVKELLSGNDDGDGVATAFARALEEVTRFGDGTLALRDDSFDRQIDGLSSQIERFEERLKGREETLLLQFSRMESAVSALQAQSAYLGSFRFF